MKWCIISIYWTKKKLLFSEKIKFNFSILFPSSFKNYKIIKELRNGSTCVTVLVEDQDTNQEYAVKKSAG